MVHPVNLDLAVEQSLNSNLFCPFDLMILFTQVVELERLRRELAYRKQLHEQQNAMISQQRAQLSMGQVIY